MRLCVAVFCFFVWGLFDFVPKVFAQTPTQSSKQKSREEEYATKTLTQPPSDLPDLPTYTGKKRFVNGFVLPNRGPTYMISFQTDQDAKVLLDWYAQAFTRSGWKIAKTDEHYFRAVKDNSCEVSTCNFLIPIEGMKSQLGINYHMSHHQ